MTQIGFHFNVPDKVRYACTLARNAVTADDAKVVVVGDAATLDALDAALWRAGPAEFVAHCRGDAPMHVLTRSPVILATRADGALPHQQVLINLMHEVLGGFERFEHLFELVTRDPQDRASGRERVRHYRHRGYAVEMKDLANRGER